MMEKKVDYRITAVTVYPDRARITYKGEVQLDSGQHSLLFDDLPLSLDIDSVRVGGKGTGNVRIIGVDVERQHYEQSPSELVTDLDDQIESLSDDLDVLEDEDAGLAAQAEHLQAMRLETREYAKGLSRGNTSVEDQSKLIQFITKQDGDIRAAQREIGIKKRRLVRQIDKLLRELEELRNLRPLQRFQARVEIDAATEAAFRPELTCVLRSAGWKPLYDIRFTQKDGKLNLGISTLAQITQNTGQDWSGVELSVSTARPALNQRLPEQKPWFIDEYQPPQPRHLRSQIAAAEPTMAVVTSARPSYEAKEMLEDDFQEVEQVQAEVKEGESIVTFELSGQWDIPSDGSPHKVLLSSQEQDPKMDYITVPRHTSAVYRRALVSNMGAGPMLAGVATLFVGDDFIGKSKIEYTPMAGELELLLGVEERIEIERKLTKREVDKRLLRENRIVRYAYEIALENLKDEIVKVEVQDQIPVSRHEQIKVKLDRIQPEPHERSDLNLIEWQQELEPKQKKKISYEFVIEYPRSMRIGGLPE